MFAGHGGVHASSGEIAQRVRVLERFATAFVHAHASCDRPATFNIDTTSGYYCTIAGVMAGFAFIALFYLVTAYSGERDIPYRRATEALGVAFISLLLVAVGYAVLAGELASGGRAATLEIIVGVAFAVAAVQLVYAVVLLITAHDQAAATMRFFQVVGVLLCPLTFLLIELGVTDYVETRTGAANVTAPIQVVGWSLLALLVGSIIVLWACGRKGALLQLRACHNRGEAPRPSGTRWRLGRLAEPSYGTLATAIGAIIGASVVSVALKPCATPAPWVLASALVIGCVALINQARVLIVPQE